MNTHPIHFDAEYAKHTEFGRPLVVSTLTLSILVGMSVSDMSQKAIANLGWERITLPNPVFVGDTLYAESTVLDKRESKSRPDQGSSVSGPWAQPARRGGVRVRPHDAGHAARQCP